MKTITSKWSVLALVVGVSMAWGCASSDGSPAPGPGSAQTQGPGATTNPQGQKTFSMVKGSITADGKGATAQALAGADTLANTKTVRVSALLEDGSFKTLAETAVNAGGVYNVQVPMDRHVLIAQAMDTSGAVIGSSIIGTLEQSVDSIIAAPISTLSSVQAMVLGALAQGKLPDVAQLATTVEALISTELGNALALAAHAGTDVQALLGAVASSVSAAQNAIFDTLGKVGGVIDTTLLGTLQAAGIQSVHSSLANIGAPVTAASELLSSLTGALTGALAGVTGTAEKAVANAISIASATFQTTIQTALSTISQTVSEVENVAFSAVKSATELEAQVVGQVVSAIMSTLTTATSAATDVLKAATDAVQGLLSAINGAVSKVDLNGAKIGFVHALVGGQSGTSADPVSSVLSLVMNLTSGLANALSTTVQGLEKLTSDLTATLTTALSNPTDIAGTVSNVMAQIAKFASDVQSLVMADLKDVLDAVNLSAITDVLGLVEGMIVI